MNNESRNVHSKMNIGHLASKTEHPRALVFLMITLLLCTTVSAQTKYEKEIRITAEEVPQRAQEFVETLAFDSKIKWYKEIGLERTSIEAKTKYEGQRYSLEFNPQGQLEDVEIKVGWHSIPAETQKKIEAYLNTRFDRYKLRKAQIQYVGDPNAILTFLKDNNNNGVTINYEMIYSSRVDKQFKLFEILFSGEGNFISASEIVSKNTDNIEY